MKNIKVPKTERKVKNIVIELYAEALIKIVKDVDQIALGEIFIDEYYFSMEHYTKIIEQINKLIYKEYYKGEGDKAGILVDKLQAVTKEMRMFNQNYGL